MDEKKTRLRGRIKKIPAALTVDERARELAMIAGRGPNHPAASDVEQARRELQGDEAAGAAVDDPNILAQRLDKRPFSTGRETPKRLPDDDETTARTVQEGIDEAAHDEMVEAAKHPTRSEE